MKHSWDPTAVTRIPACESPDGNDRSERACQNEGCGLVKITVHGSGGNDCWRIWRTKEGHEWRGDATPPCLGKATPRKPEAVSESKAEVMAR